MGRLVVVYAGGFQPFHQGHLSSYIEAKKKFPQADFYVATSANVKERPIPYEAKKFLATQAGVDPDDFPNIVVKSPLNPKEILQKYNPEEDVFVLVRSERDPMTYTKKDGTPGYYQPWTDSGKKNPFGKNAYVFVTKKHDFDINGQGVYSGTQVRELYKNSDDNGRINIVKQLYPRSKNPLQIKAVLDKYLGNTVVSEQIQKLIQNIKPLLKEASPEQKERFLKMLEAAKDKVAANQMTPAQKLELRLERLEESTKAIFDRLDKLEKMFNSKLAQVGLDSFTNISETVDYTEEK